MLFGRVLTKERAEARAAKAHRALIHSGSCRWLAAEAPAEGMKQPLTSWSRSQTAVYLHGSAHGCYERQSDAVRSRHLAYLFWTHSAKETDPAEHERFRCDDESNKAFWASRSDLRTRVGTCTFLDLVGAATGRVGSVTAPRREPLGSRWLLGKVQRLSAEGS